MQYLYFNCWRTKVASIADNGVLYICMMHVLRKRKSSQ